MGKNMKVTMSWANISDQSKAYVNDVLNSGWVSRKKYIPLFEKEFSKLHAGKRGIFMNSGTDALRMSILTLKEIYKWRNGDEVIIPGLTFVATANAVLQCGLKTVFADVQKQSGNIEPKAIAARITPMTRAVLAVHLFGLPASMRAVMQIAKRFRLKVIEDSCETVGVHRLTGDMACFSFYQSHHVQCGVGGMIVTNNPHYERVARSYMNHGRIDNGSHFKFGRIGYSSRATELEAALGVGSLETLRQRLAKRKELANTYIHQLRKISQLNIPKLINGHSWMFMPITLNSGSRDRLLRYLRANGIESREAMPLINQPCYKGMYISGTCPNAEFWTDHGLLLPLHPLMKNMDIEYVCENIRRYFK